MNEYMFYVGQEKTEDFMIMLPTDQPIYLQLNLYINRAGFTPGLQILIKKDR